jgi:hypothetical protein
MLMVTLQTAAWCLPCAPLCGQVLKGRLALLAPSIRCGNFSYEEGEGLEEDEVIQDEDV